MNHLPLHVRVPIEGNNPSITRLEEKCIKCGMCKDVCTNAIGVHGTYTFEQTGGEAVCINCGQCANVCPVDSIMEKYEYLDVKREVQNSKKIVIVSTSHPYELRWGKNSVCLMAALYKGKWFRCLEN